MSKLPRLPKSFRVPSEGYRTRHVAEYLGCDRRTIRNAERDGRIPQAVRDTNGYRIYTVKDVRHIASVLIGPHYEEVLGKFPEVLYRKRLARDMES